MSNYEIPHVRTVETVEAHTGPPPVNWELVDDFDPNWLTAFAIIAGACLFIRILSSFFGGFWTCVILWLCACMYKYGQVAFFANPLYCFIMSFVAGAITWYAIVILSEAVNAPRRIWWKITR